MAPKSIVYKLSQLRMSAGMVFQIKTDECLKARDAITVRALFLLSKPQLRTSVV